MSKKEPTRKELKANYMSNVKFAMRMRWPLWLMGVISLALAASSIWWFIVFVIVLDYIVAPIVLFVMLVVLCKPFTVEKIEILTEATEEYKAANKSWWERVRDRKKDKKEKVDAVVIAKPEEPSEEKPAMYNPLGLTVGQVIGSAFEKQFFAFAYYEPRALNLAFHSITDELDSVEIQHDGTNPYIIFNGAKYQN